MGINQWVGASISLHKVILEILHQIFSLLFKEIANFQEVLEVIDFSFKIVIS